MITAHFKEIDLTSIITAIGVALPAIIAAISSSLNNRRLKNHDAKFDDTAAKIVDIEKKVNGK